MHSWSTQAMGVLKPCSCYGRYERAAIQFNPSTALDLTVHEEDCDAAEYALGSEAGEPPPAHLPFPRRELPPTHPREHSSLHSSTVASTLAGPPPMKIPGTEVRTLRALVGGREMRVNLRCGFGEVPERCTSSVKMCW